MNDRASQVPIYLKSLELENVRCFAQRQRLDLTDERGKPVQWILILGDNGVGKTTLLQCLAWMRPMLTMRTVEPETEDDIIHEFALTEPALNNEENETWDSLIRISPEISVDLKATFTVGQTLGNGESESFNETITTEAAMTGVNGRLAVLRKQDDHVVIETHLESVNSWRADQILASDFFEIPTRSRKIEELTRERDELLENLDRSQAEEGRLNELTQKLDSLRTAEDPEDQAAMDLIRSVAASLKNDGSARP